MIRYLPSLAVALAAGLAAVHAMADERVTIETFARAETDGYFAENVARSGGTGQFFHNAAPVAIDDQPVIRMNRDTLYSGAVLDLTAPATVTLPDAGGRFMSMLVINEDHYVKDVAYAPGTVTLTQDGIGTRYVNLILRTFVDPNNPQDVAAANALQDQVRITQADRGRFEVPDWSAADRNAIRTLLNQLQPYMSSLDGRFGDVDEVDPIRHLIATAAGWGGNPPRAAVYVNLVPSVNDGVQAYTMTLKEVPVDGFWSVTVYNRDGFMEGDGRLAAVNNVTGTAGADGSFVVHLGGDPGQPNALHIMPGWGAVLRLYRPRDQIISGEWAVPALVPVP